MAEKFTITHDKAAIDKMIASLHNRHSSFRDDVQTCLVSITLHAAYHGDITLASRFIDGLGEGAKTNAMRMYLVNKKIGAPFKWILKDKETKAPAHFEFVRELADILKAKHEAAPAEVESHLMSLKWYEMDKEKPLFEGANFKAELVKLVKKFQGYQSDPEKAKHEKLDLSGMADAIAIISGGKAAAAAAGQALQ